MLALALTLAAAQCAPSPVVYAALETQFHGSGVRLSWGDSGWRSTGATVTLRPSGVSSVTDTPASVATFAARAISAWVNRAVISPPSASSAPNGRRCVRRGSFRGSFHRADGGGNFNKA